jgi:hypothetical protein
MTGPSACSTGAAKSPDSKVHRAFPSLLRRPGAWPRSVCAAAIAMLCAAHCSGSAAAEVPSAADTALSPRSNDGYATFVQEAARRFAIPASWIRAVIHIESGGDPHAVSQKGAMGLMQIMPATWASLRSRHHLGADPFDPHDNILAGTAYLRQLYERFGASGFLAAYNAGPGRFESYLVGVQPLRDETRHYLARLSTLLPDLRLGGKLTAPNIRSDWQHASLFTVQPSAEPSSSGVLSGATPPPTSFALAPRADGLFVATSSSGSR